MKLTLEDMLLTEDDRATIWAARPLPERPEVLQPPTIGKYLEMLGTAQVRKTAWAIREALWERYQDEAEFHTALDILEDLDAALVAALGPRGDAP